MIVDEGAGFLYAMRPGEPACMTAAWRIAAAAAGRLYELCWTACGADALRVPFITAGVDPPGVALVHVRLVSLAQARVCQRPIYQLTAAVDGSYPFMVCIELDDTGLGHVA